MDAGQTAVMITGVVVFLLVSAAGALGFWKWLQGKTQQVDNLALRTVFEKAVVASSLVFERLKDPFREITADGKVDPEEWQIFGKNVLAVLKELMTDGEKASLTRLTNGKTDAVLNGMLPHAVAESKSRGAGAKSTLVDPSLPQS